MRKVTGLISPVVTADLFSAHPTQAIADWPEPKKQVLELYCFEGFQPHEIASYMKIAEPEILAMLNETMPRIRQIMKEALDFG